MTPARALDSVAAALQHPIFDPLELARLRGIVERAGKVVDEAENEVAITWLAAQLTVSLISEVVDTLKEGDFKTGMECALEEVQTRLEMEARSEHSCTRNDGETFSAMAAIRARTATTPPADAGKETTT